MSDQGAGSASGTSRARLGRNVLALGAASFFTDASSEMIYPLLPVFLGSVLGASATAIGAIEGLAESVAALLKLGSGWWSDRLSRRKPLVVAGYALATIVRPLVGLAQTVGHVMAIRVTDRVGKGIRTSPRDALIADSVDPSIRGRAFGFHRAADHAGAVLGPLIAFALLQGLGLELRAVFLWAAVPGVLAVLTLIVFVRERATAPRPAVIPREPPAVIPREPPAVVPREPPAVIPSAARDLNNSPSSGGRLPRRFWGLLGVTLIFTLGNSTDAFLLLRATDVGVPVALVPLLWAMLHVVKSASSTPGGALSDRVGRVPLLVTGWLLYAAVYFGFGHAGEAWHIWALFAAYGVYFGLTEGTEKALVADLVPVDRRGTAFGWYNLAISLGALPASLIFGMLWDRLGPATAFYFGAGMALTAAAGVAVAMRGSTRDAGA